MLAPAIDRLPIASLSLATIILVRAETGSFGTAGIVEARVGIAAAVSLPVQGRLVDRFGQTAVLVPAAALNPIALVGLVVAAKGGASSAVLAAIGALSGATFPATVVVHADAVVDLVPDPVLRQSAFALDAVLLEVVLHRRPADNRGVGRGRLAGRGCARQRRLLDRWARCCSRPPALRGPGAAAGTARTGRGPLRSGGILVLLLTELMFGIRRRRDGDLHHRVRDPPRIAWACRRSDRGAGGRQHGRRPLVRLPPSRDSRGRSGTRASASSRARLRPL